MAQTVKALIVEGTGPLNLHRQHHDCCWSGYARKKGINKHGRYFLVLEFFGLEIKWVNQYAIFKVIYHSMSLIEEKHFTPSKYVVERELSTKQV